MAWTTLGYNCTDIMPTCEAPLKHMPNKGALPAAECARDVRQELRENMAKLQHYFNRPCSGMAKTRAVATVHKQALEHAKGTCQQRSIAEQGLSSCA